MMITRCYARMQFDTNGLGKPEDFSYKIFFDTTRRTAQSQKQKFTSQGRTKDTFLDLQPNEPVQLCKSKINIYSPTDKLITSVPLNIYVHAEDRDTSNDQYWDKFSLPSSSGTTKQSTNHVRLINITLSLNLPKRIGKSRDNTLFKDDSYHSSSKQLPPMFEDKYTSGKTKAELGDMLKDLMEWGSFYDNMEKVGVEMVDKLLTNRTYSLNNTYSNKILTQVIKDAPQFLAYKKIIEHEIKTANLKTVKKLKNFNELSFKRRFFLNDSYAKTRGLTITIHQIAYIEVYLDSIRSSSVDSNQVEALNIRYVLYDTYGLDDRDLKKFGLLKNSRWDSWEQFYERSVTQKTLSTGFGEFFNAWWLLQYKYDCVPFINTVEITDEIIL